MTSLAHLFSTTSTTNGGGGGGGRDRENGTNGELDLKLSVGKCIYDKITEEEIEPCPICDIDLGCAPLDKLSLTNVVIHVLCAIGECLVAINAIEQSCGCRHTDSFLNGTSSVYLEELQRAWKADPTSVDESWDNVFRNFVGQASTLPGISGQTIQESMRLLLFVRAYQVNGHMKAKLDPLNLEDSVIPDDLDPSLYGFTDADLASIRNKS
ncbi:hypothetical protein ACFE04_027048 [Oxalis oulophora]